MKIDFRNVTCKVKPKGTDYLYGNDERVFALLTDEDNGKHYLDVLPMRGMSYWVPLKYEFIAWVVFPSDKEIERNYDIEELTVNSIVTRSMISLTYEEFSLLHSAIELPQAIDPTE